MGVVGIPPQRIDEDPDRAAGRPHVFDLAAREPVVDRAATDADELTGLHDRNRFTFHALASVLNYREMQGPGLASAGMCSISEIGTALPFPQSCVKILAPP